MFSCVFLYVSAHVTSYIIYEAAADELCVLALHKKDSEQKQLTIFSVQ